MNQWFKSFLLNLSGALAFIICLLLPFQAQAREEVRLGILAHCGQELCYERWQNLADILNQEIPESYFVIKPLDFDESYQSVAGKKIDFVLVNPALYVEFEYNLGVQRIATLKNNSCKGHGCQPFFASVILARSQDRELADLSRLKGRRIMAVHEKSFGGWMMAARRFKAIGIDPQRDFSSLTFIGNHDEVVKAVLKGRADCGIVRTGVLERLVREGVCLLSDFTIVGSLPEVAGFPFVRSTRFYPEWPLAKLKHTPDLLAERVVAALFNYKPAGKGKIVVPYTWSIPRNYQAVHECLKELRLPPYADFGRISPQAVLKAYWPTFGGSSFFSWGWPRPSFIVRNSGMSGACGVSRVTVKPFIVNFSKIRRFPCLFRIFPGP